MFASYTYRPVRFFACTFAITWCAWFAAAFYSHGQNKEALLGLLMLLGLLGPLLAALVCAAGASRVRNDIGKKLFRIRQVPARFWLIAVFLVPGLIAVAIVLSSLMGQSLSQFQLSGAISIMDGRPLFSLLIVFLAPALEELGWSSYGIDSLQAKSGNIFNAALLFGLLWSLWHLPLFFIKGYYHYDLFVEHPLFALNFFISVVPLTIITNWLYFKNGRSIPLAIVFHISAVLASELFMITNQTKCLVTLVCLAVAAVLVWRDREFFFTTRPMLAS